MPLASKLCNGRPDPLCVGPCSWHGSTKSFPLLCPQCGAELRIIGFVTETLSVSRSLRFAVLLRLAARSTHPWCARSTGQGSTGPLPLSVSSSNRSVSRSIHPSSHPRAAHPNPHRGRSDTAFRPHRARTSARFRNRSARGLVSPHCLVSTYPLAGMTPFGSLCSDRDRLLRANSFPGASPTSSRYPADREIFRIRANQPASPSSTARTDRWIDYPSLDRLSLMENVAQSLGRWCLLDGL
jgi:hypothetical protein